MSNTTAPEKPAEPKKTGSLDQQRAAYAWQSVEGCGSDYCNLAKAAPALIMTNGLMQTLAYYQEKGKNYHSALSKHLREWLLKRRLVEQSDFSSVMTALQTADAARFRQATEETIALLRWIRQFAAAKAQG